MKELSYDEKQICIRALIDEACKVLQRAKSCTSNYTSPEGIDQAIRLLATAHAMQVRV